MGRLSNTQNIPSPPLGERVRVRGSLRIKLSGGPLTPALSPSGGEGDVLR